MRTPFHRNVTSLSLSLLLLLPVIPVGAGEAAVDQGGNELHLVKALAAQGAALPFELTEEVVRFEIELPDRLAETSPVLLERSKPVQWMASEETSRIAFETQVARQVNTHGGFGKWLKKYWYVPVIAGAVLGVAVSDDGSDSNDDDSDG